jgi:hypothetical protein
MNMTFVRDKNSSEAYFDLGRNKFCIVAFIGHVRCYTHPQLPVGHSLLMHALLGFCFQNEKLSTSIR